MLTVLYPTYTIKVVVQDIPHGERGTGLQLQKLYHHPEIGATGCDEVLLRVTEALRVKGLLKFVSIELEKFDHQAQKTQE